MSDDQQPQQEPQQPASPAQEGAAPTQKSTNVSVIILFAIIGLLLGFVLNYFFAPGAIQTKPSFKINFEMFGEYLKSLPQLIKMFAKHINGKEAIKFFLSPLICCLVMAQIGKVVGTKRS